MILIQCVVVTRTSNYLLTMLNSTLPLASVSRQQSLDNLTSWANDWQLKINIVISLSSELLSSDFAYVIDGIFVSAHTSHIDLGITISQDLSFLAHIENIVCKARQRINTL
jgi:hypothetical protein